MVRHPVIAAHGFSDGQHLHPRLLSPAVDYGLVGLEEGAGVVLVGELNPRREKATAFLRAEPLVIRVVFPGAALTENSARFTSGPNAAFFFWTCWARCFISDIWRIPHSRNF